ncbi:MAG: aquaporin family protein [Leptolyngbya sp.]|nr:aquaporin family protein [Candidatus Melainabacteria bacterium]
MFLRSLVAECLGTAFLLATVIGSGILLHKIDAGNVAVTVFGIAVATGGVLYALIQTLGSISAHFNPVVTLVSAIRGELRWGWVAPYAGVQILGAIVGVMLANLMFDGAAISFSNTQRAGSGQWLSEFIATFGLIGVILGTSKGKPDAVPQAVSTYVMGAILFTSSTCFANPAVTISRIFTDTICGIRPVDVPAFIGCQIAGALAALLVFGWLLKPSLQPSKAPSEQHPEHLAAREKQRELTAVR